jgi:hypothetical protein
MRLIRTGRRLAAGVLLAGALPAAIAADAGAHRAFKVTSTLDGKRVLPHRIRWVAHARIPRTRIAKVEFLIDGKLRWVERKSPYVFGDDSDWLVTSWLTPGRHRFMVRVVAKDGRRSTDLSTARVVPSPPPPGELADTSWRHTLVNQGELGSPPGVWTLRIDHVGWEITDPKGSTNLIDVAYPASGLVELRGGIWTRPRSSQEGNGWCEDTNQAVRYQWSVANGQLTLALSGPKRCGDQATVLSGAGVPQSSGGTWTSTS